MINIKCEVKQLKQFQKRLEEFEQREREELIRAIAKELAARLLAKVTSRTPVKTGTLKRGWTSKTKEEAASGGGHGKNPREYANSLPIVKKGNVYEIEVFNPVEYASHFEYGHRQEVGRYVKAIGKRLKKPWVNGRFPLKISRHELNNETPKIIREKIENQLKKVF